MEYLGTVRKINQGEWVVEYHQHLPHAGVSKKGTGPGVGKIYIEKKTLVVHPDDYKYCKENASCKFKMELQQGGVIIARLNLAYDMRFWEILVPTIKNDGTPIKTKYHKVWDEKVRKISGGLTIIPPIKGQWISHDGELFNERMIPVRICCTEKQIDIIADMTATYYNQKAIMYYLITDRVIIKNY
jgi:hypothetical protein